MAHLVFFDTQANAQKTKRAIFCQRTDEQTDRQIDNYSNILYIEKRGIQKYKLNLWLDIFRQQWTELKKYLKKKELSKLG